MTSVFLMTNKYQTIHMVLLMMNEMNKFLCITRRSHFSELTNNTLQFSTFSTTLDLSPEREEYGQRDQQRHDRNRVADDV